MEPDNITTAKTALARYPGLTDVAVLEHDTGHDTPCLIAYVVPAGPGLDTAALHAHARSTLHGTAMPAAITIIDQIPLTPAGTIDTTALPAPELDGLLPYHPPATPRQELLCELFAEVLGVPRCGTRTDFFDLGGRSVEAMVLAGHINARLNTRITMADLFKTPTVADLDHRLSEGDNGR